MGSQINLTDNPIIKAFQSGTHTGNILGIIGSALQVAYAIITLVALVALIINITRLATSAGNPNGRSNALHGILVSGVCLSILGGLGFVYAIVLLLIK